RSMTESQFRSMLAEKGGRYRACLLLAAAKVDEWSDDGQAEVVRCLACWMDNGLDLSDDDVLVELACGCEVIVDKDAAEWAEGETRELLLWWLRDDGTEDSIRTDVEEAIEWAEGLGLGAQARQLLERRAAGAVQTDVGVLHLRLLG